MHPIQIDPTIHQAFPHYSLLIVYARGLRNAPSNGLSTHALRQAEALQRSQFTHKPSEHPHIAAWREAYAAFGLKPSKFLCSVEALLSRTLKGNDLPSINMLVDLYNAVSVKHLLPVGGENWDRLAGPLVLQFATGTEPFDTVKDGQLCTEFPQAGEVIWADPAGVTCRAWNWRQGLRTRLSEDTTNAYFMFDCLQPYSIEALKAAGQELMDYLGEASPGCELETELMAG
jgi:DNA/RNA-binding domain of Phe-tRNA-synthetase-like protein